MRSRLAPLLLLTMVWPGCLCNLRFDGDPWAPRQLDAAWYDDAGLSLDRWRLVYQAPSEPGLGVLVQTVDGSGFATHPIEVSGPNESFTNLLSSQLTGDGSTVVYVADQDVEQHQTLYAASAAPTGPHSNYRLSSPADHVSHLSARAAPTGSRVLFISDAEVADERRLYLVDASTSLMDPVQISPDGAIVDSIDVVHWHPEATSAVFVAKATADGTSHPYFVDLSGEPPVFAVEIDIILDEGSPDSRVVPAPDGNSLACASQGQLFWVDLSEGVPGAPVPLLPEGYGLDGAPLFTPTNDQVVYQGQGPSGFGLFRIQVGAEPGNPIEVSGPFVSGGRASNLSIATAGDQMLYLADQVVLDRRSVYWASLTSPVPEPIRLTPEATLESPTGHGYLAAFVGNTAHVVLQADLDTQGQVEIYTLQNQGSGPAEPSKVHSSLSEGQVVQLIAAPSGGSAILYLADYAVDNTFDLYRVEIHDGLPGLEQEVSGILPDSVSVQSGATHGAGPRFIPGTNAVVYVSVDLASGLQTLWLQGPLLSDSESSTPIALFEEASEIRQLHVARANP